MFAPEGVRIMRDGAARDAVPELEVRLLGHASIMAAGEPVKFAKRATTMAMLAWIVLQRGRPVARDALAFTLFPDWDKEAALDGLRHYLSRANKALPTRASEPWLIADAETIRWNTARGAFVDAIEFERLASDPATQASAVDLYAGDLLEDVYEDWIVAERERLRALYLQALHDLVAANRSARNHPVALRYARRFLAIEPWREDMVRQVMAIHYALGDSSGALGEYDRFADRLREEMGTAAMPETLAVRDAIDRGEALIGSVDATVSAGTDHADRKAVRALPFFGRESERAALQAHWDRAARGFGGVVLVSGEAGVGKTRLVGELARVAEAQSGRVYAGSTSSPESSPYQCIAEALRAALPVLSAGTLDVLKLGILSRILPELRAQAGDLPEVAALEPDRESARLFASLADAVVRLASQRPLLLVLEDLHWAAGATIDALAAITRRIDRAQVLIVVTYRQDETPATHPIRMLADALGAKRRTAELHLERFSRADVAQLVAQLDDLGERDETMVDRLYAFSEGNLLFLNEAIANALETSGDSFADAGSGLRGIAGVIAARTARLGDSTRIVAEIAAICGYGCSVDVVRDVAGLSTAQASEAFNELLDRRLVREAGARDHFDYVFTHHLIGTSIYEQIDAEVCVRRHARIAYVLEERAGRRVGVARELAHHYDLAGMPEHAARWYGQAAREAAVVYANDDAVALSTLAIERQNDPTLLIDALFVREEANARLGHRQAQTGDLDRLEQLAESAELHCRILGRRILLLRWSDDRQAEREAIEALRRHALTSGDRYWQGRAACADARFLVATAQYAAAKEAAREALAHFEAAGGVRDRIEALLPLSASEEATGNIDEADRLLEQARSIASGGGDRSAIAETLMQAARFRRPWRQERALSLSEKALEQYRAIGDRVGEARALTSISAAATWLQRWERARGAIVAAGEIFEATDDRVGLMRVLRNQASLHFRCGDFTRARGFFARAREQCERLGERSLLGILRANEAAVAICQDRPQEAKSLAQAALDISREIEQPVLRSVALLHVGLAERDLGELEAALVHMDEALALAREAQIEDIATTLALVALARAMHGDLAVAMDLAEEIFVSDRSLMNSTIFPPYPPWIAACVFHWSGDEERARQALDWASQLALSISGSIDVPELRTHFEALWFNIAIAKAKEANRWPPLLA